MALITDPDDLNAGGLTSPANAVWGTPSSFTVTITGTGLAAIGAGDFFEVRDHSVPANNGLYVETGGTPLTTSITADHLTDTPVASGAEAVAMYGTTGTPLSIMYDTKLKEVWLVEQGNLSADGVTMLAIHSRFKDDWKADATLIPIPFPMTGIDFDAGKWEIGTDPSGNFSGWKFKETIASPVAANIERLIRNAGWNTYRDDGTFRTKHFNVTTLGSMEDETTDQPYYRFGNDPTDTGAAADLEYAGPANEPIKFFDATVTRAQVTPNGYDFLDASPDTIDRNDGGSFITDGYLVGGQVTVTNAETSGNDGTYEITAVGASSMTVTAVGGGDAGLNGDTDDNTATLAVDNSNSFDIFLRVRDADPEGKTFAQANLASAGETSIVNKVIKFPLSNATDLDITATDASIAGGPPWDEIFIRYFDQAYARDGLSGGPYNFGIVVDVGTHSIVDGSAPGAASVLTTAEGGMGVNEYQGGDLYCHEGSDVGTSWVIASNTATTITVTGTIASVTNGSFHAQLATPIVADKNEIYEKVQYLLRQAADIDDTTNVVTGNTADEMAVFIGPDLIMGRDLPVNPNGGGSGVLIEGFDSNDTNNIYFWDNTPVAARNYPFVSAGSIAFNANLYPDDPAPEYWMFFEYTTRTNLTDGAIQNPTGPTYDLYSPGSNLPALSLNDYIKVDGFTEAANNGLFQVDVINVSTQDYEVSRVDGQDVGGTESAVTIDVDQDPIDTADAVIVNNNAGSPIEGAIGAASVSFDFDYDGNVQGGRTAATNASVIIRAIGTTNGQFVQTAPLLITRTTGLSFSVVSALERNYLNP